MPPFSNPFSFLFKNRLSGGVTAEAVQLRLVVCFAAAGRGILKAGYYEEAEQTRENCSLSGNSLPPMESCWSGSVAAFKDAIFSYSASSLKRNDPDPLGLRA